MYLSFLIHQLKAKPSLSSPTMLKLGKIDGAEGRIPRCAGDWSIGPHRSPGGEAGAPGTGTIWGWGRLIVPDDKLIEVREAYLPA